MMKSFRKKPVIIQAVQFTKEMAEGLEELPEGVEFRGRTLTDGKFPEYMKEYWPSYDGFHKHVITTLEGEMRVNIGDWIIIGIKGERYPCKPDIFEATYEEIGE